MGGNGGGFGAVINIPFSWEHKPGVSKVAAEQISTLRDHHHNLGGDELPSKKYIPPPPPLKCINNYPQEECEPALGKLLPQDDPFLMAYCKCTDQETVLFEDDDEAKSSSSSRLTRSKRRYWSSARKERATKSTSAAAAAMLCPTSLSSGALSCKYSCVVRSDNIVRVVSSNSNQHRQNAIIPPPAASPTKHYRRG